jgi:hypothetical protein
LGPKTHFATPPRDFRSTPQNQTWRAKLRRAYVT